MSDVMLSLGGYQFSVNTAAYQTLERTTEHRWASQERFGQGPVLQYTGFESETIRLEGVIYPRFRGGLVQLDKMREEAAKGQPLALVSALGFILGDWVIERIRERQGEHAMAGLPQKVEFSLELRRYDNDAGNATVSSNYSGPQAGGPYDPGETPGARPVAQSREQEYVARIGDVLDRVVQRYYGQLGGRLLERVMDRNRGIGDLGAVLPAGTRISLPPLAPEVSVSRLPKLWG